MAAHTTARKTANVLFSAPYTHTGVQHFIQWLMDSQGIGQFDLSKRSGLSPATIYQILAKSENDVTRPPRRSTLSALAKAIRAEVRYEGDGNRFYLTQQFELPRTEGREISLLLSDIGRWIMSRRKPLSREERERIVRVVKALVAR